MGSSNFCRRATQWLFTLPWHPYKTVWPTNFQFHFHTIHHTHYPPTFYNTHPLQKPEIMSHNRTDKTLLGTGAGVVHKDEERLMTEKLGKTTLVDRDERVVHEAPIVKKDVVTEHPEIIHKEHHVQHIIHEKEVHVKPIHRVEDSTERPVIHRVRHSPHAPHTHPHTNSLICPQVFVEC